MYMQVKIKQNAGLALLSLCLFINALPTSALESKLTLIHLNDLHANLTPHNDLVRIVSQDGTPYSKTPTPY
jgi:2',3'-cyclic-nucleotide 2'-phosphodiesterase (5'-nucleotidase family)